MQGETVTKKFSEDYINTCFTVWYSLGQPTNMNLVIDQIPESPDGNKPARLTLSKFKEDYGWVERADALNAKAVELVDKELVDTKAELLRKQFKVAAEVGQKAIDHILEDGFDSSSSAVNALRWASEEQRIVIGVSEMLVKISKLPNEDALARYNKLLQRKNSVEAEIVSEEDDNTETSE